MRKFLISIATIAVIFTACGSSTDTSPPAPVQVQAPASTDQSGFVDWYEGQHPGTVATFCNYVGTLGESASREAFMQGWLSSNPDYAQGSEVFDEILSRC
jgi:hypothetical protein